jgi:O-methyltransferase involved in polyketide biosynthesis
MNTPAYSRISPTAKVVAALRVFTDIPFSREIAMACHADEVLSKTLGLKAQDFLWAAPYMEIRYKSVDGLLGRFGCRNIVELAGGLSPRGLIWSQDQEVTYLETDLPEILAEKQKIVTGILCGKPRKNLSWLSVNVVDNSSFQSIGSFFDNDPIAVVNEGLLMYLSREEQKLAARNIHHLLTERGGIWITPDVMPLEQLEGMIRMNPTLVETMRTFSVIVGRDIRSNFFSTLEEAERFFMEIGFKITRWSQREVVPRLSSPDRASIDTNKINALLDLGQVWAMQTAR